MTMYNKIFTKILDSSVWLEATPTRIVWITMIAAMDEVGFCQFAAVGNVASRARVTEDEARAALQALESPDPESSDDSNEGKRIERVPGGWIVLNAPKYRALVTRVNVQERTRERVRKFREKKRNGNADVTQVKRQANADVTPSESESDTKADKKPSRRKRTSDDGMKHSSDPRHVAFKEAVHSYWKFKNGESPMPWGPMEGAQLGMFLRDAPHITIEQFQGMLKARAKSKVNHGERPCQWIKWITSYGPGPVNEFKNTMEVNGNGGTDKTNRSGVTAERTKAARTSLAEAALARGYYSVDDALRSADPPLSRAGERGRDAGVSGGLRSVSGEVLNPGGRGGGSGSSG